MNIYLKRGIEGTKIGGIIALINLIYFLILFKNGGGGESTGLALYAIIISIPIIILATAILFLLAQKTYNILIKKESKFLTKTFWLGVFGGFGALYLLNFMGALSIFRILLSFKFMMASRFLEEISRAISKNPILGLLIILGSIILSIVIGLLIKLLKHKINWENKGFIKKSLIIALILSLLTFLGELIFSLIEIGNKATFRMEDFMFFSYLIIIPFIICLIGGIIFYLMDKSQKLIQNQE